MTAEVVVAGDDLPLTVAAVVAARAGERGEHPLLINDDDTLSYAALDRRSARLARGLLAIGAGKGTHVGLLFANTAQFVVAAVGAARIGAVVVPLSTMSTRAELRGLLRGADIEVMLAAASVRGNDHLALVDGAIGGLDLSLDEPQYLPEMPALRRVYFDHHGVGSLDRLVALGDRIGSEALAAAEALVTPADRLVIVHTSGSTSAPKGVIHQHGALIRHQHNLNELRGLTADEVLFSNSPFFWIGGFGYSLLGTLVAGATLVCSVATEPARTLDLLERVRPTMVNGFAQAVAYLAADPTFPSRDLSSIRRGNLWPIMPENVRALDPQLRHNLLGMTETGSVCLAGDDESDQPEHRRGSFGKPVPGFQARVIEPDTGQRCAAGQIGELWLRGPFLMEGYYGRERHETFEPGGWFRTGDLFHVDEEGWYYFHCRRGDMIKTAGANVSPREVEASIAELIGFVSHVLGIDDEQRGQIVVAVIRVPANSRPLNLEALRQDLRERLSPYKVPRRMLAIADADVPMLSSGKLDTAALRDWIAAQ